MKKTFLSICTLIMTALFSGCTLSMDEYALPEEERGVEEAYTEETPFGNVTYQYNDGVTPLNGDNQNYIVKVEADTIVYLRDDIPADYRPQPGRYLAANCSRQTPLGLNLRVLSVTNVGGILKAVCTQASQKEVYRQLDIDIDLKDYAVPRRTLYDSTEVAEKGIDLADSTDVDMRVFDVVDSIGRLPAGTRARSWGRSWAAMTGGKSAATRGSDEDVNENKTHEETFEVTLSKEVGKMTYEVKVKSVEHKSFHIYQRSADDYREEWTDTYSQRTYTLNAQYGEPTPVDKTKGFIPKKYKEKIENAKGALDTKTKNLVADDIVIPIPGTCVSILLEFTGSGKVTIGAFGEASVTLKTATKRTGAIFSDGDETPIDKEVAPESKFSENDYEVFFGGTADANLTVRGGVGILVGAAKVGGGVVVGIQAKAGIKLNVETEAIGDDEVDRENCYIQPYFGIGGYAKGVLKLGPFTFDVGELEFLYKEWNTTFTLSPQVDTDKLKRTSQVVEYQAPDAPPVHTILFQVDICFSKLSSIQPAVVHDYRRAAIRIYSGDMDRRDFKTFIIDKDVTDTRIQAKKVYHFEVNQAEAGIAEADEYHVVPCIYYVDDGTICEYPSGEMVYGSHIPVVSDLKVSQVYGQDVSPEDMEWYDSYFGAEGAEGLGKSMDLAEYSFDATVRLKKGRAVKKLGFLVEIYNKDNRQLMKRECLWGEGNVAHGTFGQGKYTLNLTFVSTVKPARITDGLYVRVRPFVEYRVDGKLNRKEFAWSAAITMEYPYQRKGGGATGNLSSTNLNMD